MSSLGISQSLTRTVRLSVNDVSLFLATTLGKAYIPRKAEGETVPLLRDTMTLIPVSMKGTEKSTTSDRSSFMVREPTAM